MEYVYISMYYIPSNYVSLEMREIVFIFIQIMP